MGKLEEINVDLYGGKPLFGGRETALEASIIMCDMYKECSFYEEGKCLSVRSFATSNCKHGSTKTVKGYTSRAQKYRTFRDKWKSHDNYNKLNYPKKKVGLIGTEVVLLISYIRIEKGLEGYLFKNPDFSSGRPNYIPYEDFNSEFIKGLLDARPQAMMGGTIDSYQREELPLVLAHIKETLPEKYNQFMEDYPEYDVSINHVGRKAYLHTLNPGLITIKKGSGSEVWQWDGEYLSLQTKKSLLFLIEGDYDLESLVIKPKDTLKVEVTDNAQVNENTKFDN